MGGDHVTYSGTLAYPRIFQISGKVENMSCSPISNASFETKANFNKKDSLAF